MQSPYPDRLLKGGLGLGFEHGQIRVAKLLVLQAMWGCDGVHGSVLMVVGLHVETLDCQKIWGAKTGGQQLRAWVHHVQVVMDTLSNPLPAMPAAAIPSAPGTAPQQQQQQQFPNTLPACTVSAEGLKENYGLKHVVPLLANGPVWAAEKQQLMQWVGEPVRMDRDGGASNARSRDNLGRNVELYLGFLLKHQGASKPSLSSCLQANNVASFIAFQLARGNSHATLQQYITSLEKVQEFLASIASSQEDRAAAMASKAWTSRARTQLARAMPSERPSIAELKAKKQWLDPEEMVAYTNKFVVAAKQAVIEQGWTQVSSCICLTVCS